MRLACCAIALLLCGGAFADRFVETPTGYSVRHRWVKTEAWWANGRDFDHAYLGVGIAQGFDIGATLNRYGQPSDRFGLDASWNYIRPLTDYAPGISVGMVDVLNETEMGRAAYFALTYRIGNYDPGNQDVPTDFSFGWWTRDGGSLFLSCSLPFSYSLRMISEYDGRQLAAGVEIRPFPDATIRWVFREGNPVIGFGYSARF